MISDAIRRVCRRLKGMATDTDTDPARRMLEVAATKELPDPGRRMLEAAANKGLPEPEKSILEAAALKELPDLPARRPVKARQLDRSPVANRVARNELFVEGRRRADLHDRLPVANDGGQSWASVHPAPNINVHIVTSCPPHGPVEGRPATRPHVTNVQRHLGDLPVENQGGQSSHWERVVHPLPNVNNGDATTRPEHRANPTPQGVRNGATAPKLVLTRRRVSEVIEDRIELFV